MTVQELEERKQKVLDKIEKKQNTISKKEGWIEKKQKEMESLTDERDIHWKEYEINELKDDIKRLNKEIEEAHNTVDGYDAKIEKAKEKEDILYNKIPDSLKDLQKQLESDFIMWEYEYRDAVTNKYKEYEQHYEKSFDAYKAFIEKYSYNVYQVMYETDEEIQKEKRKDAEYLVLNLYNRVFKITGEVESWDNIRLESGNQGTVLNGYVTGKNGTAKVESIEAGGYNIQCRHIRVLVHAVK